MGSLSMWLKWSWRDFRSRWVQVVVISLIIALGVGAYSGLTSTTKWRKATADNGYELLNMYDLRVQSLPSPKSACRFRTRWRPSRRTATSWSEAL